MEFLHTVVTFLCCILLSAVQIQARQFCYTFGNGSKSNSILEDIIKNEIATLGGSNDGAYHVDKQDINLTHPAISLYGDLSNFTVSNLNEYKLKTFNIKLDDSSLAFEIFNLTFQNISLSGGTYNWTGNIGDLFNIFGDGDFWLNLLNFSISTSILLDGIKVNKTAACIGLDISVYVEQVVGYFDNFMYDPELERIVNKSLTGIGPDAIRILWTELFENKYYDDGNNDGGGVLDRVSKIITKSLAGIGNDDRFVKAIQNIAKKGI